MNELPEPVSKEQEVYMGLKHNDYYCDIVDSFNLIIPNNIFKNIHFITDYPIESESMVLISSNLY